MTAPYAILTDTTLCIGCEECVHACKEENSLGKDVSRRWKLRIDDLSSTRYTTLVRKKGNRFIRKQCRHCIEPACASACIVGALKRTSEGAVIYDPDKCMGCRYCMMACPYGIPRYDWEKPVPLIRKCTFCYSRITKDKPPACVQACRQKATLFGSRETLLKEAHRRIQAEPHKYVNKVFGETEVGGTSVLYISDISLDFLAWKPELKETPPGDATWAALSKVPPIVLGMGGLMAGVWWITGRRNKVASEEPSSQQVADNTSARSENSTPADKENKS
ncbi:MAG: 4Fe-4S dicluster domain-containing protein [Proteobacteria bacterium]|nr:4Fe-4S dicluster domain-containing protein [Pseudomonadota bacterium]